MDQASASSAASCARNPVAPRTSSSCSRSADRSQTGVPPPARSGPQSEPHAEPSNRHPSPSSPPSADSRLRAIRCRSFTPAQPHNPAASLRDYCSGAYIEILPRFSDKRQAVNIFQQIEADISAYLVTITIMNAGVGIAVGAVMWLTGLGDPVLWGAVAFLLNFLP